MDSGGQALPISAHEMAPIRAFSILQKWPKMAKMTSDDFLTPKMVLIEPQKIIWAIWTQNYFSGNIAS